MKHYILDELDNPVPALNSMVVSFWKAQNWSRCILGQDDIGSYTDGFYVSTVFVGHDMRLPGAAGPPLLWATCIASVKDQRMVHYSSRQDAERGHAEAVLWAVREAARRGGRQ